jgi:hypothetical protein
MVGIYNTSDSNDLFKSIDIVGLVIGRILNV